MSVTLLQQQQAAFDEIQSFLKNDGDIFILKGYAGTGKTTMIKYIVDYLKAQNVKFTVMAPTGRAAKVLRDKVGYGATIHRSIYSKELTCIEVEDDDKSKKSFQFVFPIIEEPSNEELAIVDESSMISDVESHGEFFVFGSGRLLTDLLSSAKAQGIRKILFVGDPAQLPPVTDPYSRALDEAYFAGLGYKVASFELTDVIRQSAESKILQETFKIRDLLAKPRQERKSFVMSPNGQDIISVSEELLPQLYTDLYPSPEVGNGQIVCFSNRLCKYYVDAVRRIIFSNPSSIQVGDILIISSNNYNTYHREIFNGDQVKVFSVGKTECHPNIPVSIGKEKRHINLTFRDIEVLYPDTNDLVPCKIIEDFLESDRPELSNWQMRALYIDFILRHKGLKEGTPEFKKAFINDPYFNALRVKYGYAITCHKSQGGEWDTVFVDYSGRCGLADAHLRWCYTATTRAKQKLYIINAPNITAFSKLVFSQIAKISKAPKDFWPSYDINTPFHNDSIPFPVKHKCLGIIESLTQTAYSIDRIQSCNYQEKYHFKSTEGETIEIDVWYDGSGFFRKLPVSNDGSPRDMLCDIINKSSFEVPQLNYTPSSDLTRELFQKVYTASVDADVTIANVVEMLDSYYVNYYLITDARFATIQFYIQGENRTMLSTAMPKSELGNDDAKLVHLINILKNVI